MLPAAAGMGFGAAELGLNALDKGLVPALRESLPGQALQYVGLLDTPVAPAPILDMSAGPTITSSATQVPAAPPPVDQTVTARRLGLGARDYHREATANQMADAEARRLAAERVVRARTAGMRPPAGPEMVARRELARAGDMAGGPAAYTQQGAVPTGITVSDRLPMSSARSPSLRDPSGLGGIRGTPTLAARPPTFAGPATHPTIPGPASMSSVSRVPPAGPSTLGRAAEVLGGAGAGLTTEGVMGLLGQKTNLGSQVGAAIGGAALAPFVPVIGGYLGGFIGGRVGSMFGPGVSVGPNGNASLGLNNGQLSVVDIGTDNNQPSEPIQQFSQAMVDGINKMSADGLVQFNSVIGSPAVFQKNTGLRVFDGSDDGKWVRADTGADLMSEMLFYNLVTGNAEVTNPEQFRETINLMEGSATNRINTILDQQAEGTFEPASMKDIRKADQIGKGLEQTTEGPQRSGIGRATKAAIGRFPGAGSYITQQGLLQDWNRARGLPLNAPMRQPTEAELKTSPAQRLTAEKLLGARLRSGLGGRGRTRGI